MDALVPYNDKASVEVQFAKALENFKLSLNRTSPSLDGDDLGKPTAFDFVRQFSQITADEAYSFVASNFEDSMVAADISTNEDFVYWDLETKLWRLVENLYSYRVFAQEEEIFGQEREIGELLVLLDWLQFNSRSGSEEEPRGEGEEGEDDLKLRSKWSYTRMSAETINYAALAGNPTNPNLVSEVDVDAPLRQHKEIESEDAEVDSKNCQKIYQLVLLGEYHDAIEYANETGNHTLAIILSGAIESEEEEPEEEEEEGKKRGKFDRSLWTKLVYKLSKNPDLDLYEKMIYTYLSGGDVSENLKMAASASYEEYMNILVRQLLTYSLLRKSKSHEFVDLTPPRPQTQSIKGILNAISSSGATKAAEESRHPIRIITASVIIEELDSIIRNVNDDTDDNIVRIVTHLSIFLAMIRPVRHTEQLNALITLYVSKLAENNQTDLIPLYLSFIPDEKDAREVYSLILSSITDKSQRQRQLEIAKRIAQPVVDDDDMIVVDNVERDKLVNVLRRTVERVMEETASHYTVSPGQSITVTDDDEFIGVDDVDLKLSNSVEWFYENEMWDDAIAATLAVIRRFLSVGKLQALRSFARGKDFNHLISEFDLAKLGRSKESEEGGDGGEGVDVDEVVVSDEQRKELLNYSNFVKGLNGIYECRQIGQVRNEQQPAESTIRQTGKTLHTLLATWLLDVEKTDPILQELRTIYVPYLIMELISIYQNARHTSWNYVKDAYKLVHLVANDTSNDFLRCFTETNRLDEFLSKVAGLSINACERGMQGVYCL
ncbi:uncharacterized protein LODBEIA_P51710 [Lodderomyces beijingensis]|uniref:Nuclear pore complex protein n=1 Tax=Lodderomyces beijingensis TaxID=1775926 RepID=A0ABP0ZS42_9ASCO